MKRALYHEDGGVFEVEVLSDEGSVALPEHGGAPMRRVRLRCIRTVRKASLGWELRPGSEWTSSSNIDHPGSPWRLEYVEDEPTFTLRAQDELAPATVRAWAQLANTVGVPEEKGAQRVRARRRDGALAGAIRKEGAGLNNDKLREALDVAQKLSSGQYSAARREDADRYLVLLSKGGARALSLRRPGARSQGAPNYCPECSD